jgi:hypothetical protein
MRALALLLCAAAPSLSRGGLAGRARDGAAPPGVLLDKALATARRLQPELFDDLPKEWLAVFKSPCWYLNSTHAPETRLDAVYHSELRCLPYFYLLVCAGAALAYVPWRDVCRRQFITLVA